MKRLTSRSSKVAPSPNVAAAFGVTAEYRAKWGEEAFRSLSSVAFAEADADKSGTMDLSELKATLSKIRIELSDAEVAQVLKRYDDDASGTISEAEWHRLLGDLLDGTLSLTSSASAGEAPPPAADVPDETDVGRVLEEAAARARPRVRRHPARGRR